jgi:hypothetical protein
MLTMKIYLHVYVHGFLMLDVLKRVGTYKMYGRIRPHFNSMTRLCLWPFHGRIFDCLWCYLMLITGTYSHTYLKRAICFYVHVFFYSSA